MKSFFCSLVALLLTWLLVWAVIHSIEHASGAPAPLPRQERHRQALHVVPGKYLVSYNGNDWHAVLSHGGAYEAYPESDRWQTVFGSWSYEPRTRTLTVRKRHWSDTGEFDEWSARLDSRMEGEMAGGDCKGLTVKLTRE